MGQPNLRSVKRLNRIELCISIRIPFGYNFRHIFPIISETMQNLYPSMGSLYETGVSGVVRNIHYEKGVFDIVYQRCAKCT